MARNREATAQYVWEPYFHNPKLRRRLRRVAVPTLLLWGADDRFVTPDYYGAAYRAAIPGARSPEQARANAAAADLPALPPEVMAEIRQLYMERAMPLVHQRW